MIRDRKSVGMTGALALATFVKAGTMIFLGAPRSGVVAQARDGGPGMRGPMLALAGLCGVVGLAPVVFWPMVARAVGSWRPAWAMVEVPVPLVTLGMVHLGLAVLMVLASLGLWRKAQAGGLRRGLTWDCGYATPSGRMQYVSGSFAGIASGWFRFILLPEREQRRPRGPFPAKALRLDRIPETVLERLIGPASRAIMRVSTAVRRLQHGRLQFYILYLVVGLIALGTLVLVG